MSEPIPSLNPTERAMLERFRVDESPDPAARGRVLAALQVQVGLAPVALPSPWLWLRAGGLSFAIAASTLVVLGGTARVLDRVRAPAPLAAADAVPDGTPSEIVDAPVRADDDASVTPPVVTPPPVVPVADPEPAAIESASSRDRPRAAGSRDAAPKPAVPVDAAAEIAAFRTIKLEQDNRARLAAIARYRDAFDGGTFVQEVAVLELQTLCALGRTGDAARQGAAFVQRYGDSAYAAIARRGCTDAPK